ncbi:septum formation protein [Scopulibacillus daqui]|uniref:dTTP/UTP pyrophosphatase n=1 Tax=Scopulibacillus daqui TaxID=1469162 RepID=A0ABS2Q2N3_9BACL|nr:Maf family protein [Scopulibacillus daqui]MBM7645964.1 septum formation protein [Scopulibacillus daqui]
MKQRKLILASSSPRRRELIQTLGLPVEIRKNDVDETIHEDLMPSQVVRELSLRKAKAAYAECKKNNEHGIIIGSDTIVVLNSQRLGKPKNEEDAFHMLSMLQGNIHEVYSGIACIDAETGHNQTGHSMTEVKIKALSDEQIKRYISTGEPMDKAGAYGIQGLGATFVERINGDYFTVVGLPLSLLSDILGEFGVQVL